MANPWDNDPVVSRAKPQAKAGAQPWDNDPVVTKAAPAAQVEDSPTLSQHMLNLDAGLVRGAGSIGATLAWPVDKFMDLYYGDRKPTVEGLITGKQPESRNEERRRQMTQTLQQEFGANPDSLMFKGGKIGGEIAGTAGAGGVVGNVLGRALPAVGVAPHIANALATSARTGGFSTGLPAATTLAQQAGNIGVRMTGGALTGGVSAAMIDPQHTGTGVVVGGLAPPVVSGIAKAGGYAGRTLYSLAQPFTAAGQERLAGGIINKFAKDGPTALDNAERVIGSKPTLAEATGNAGIAGLQRNVSDTVQGASNRFRDRLESNMAARFNAFEDMAGDAGRLEFFKASRDAAADDLYGRAAQADIGANMTPAIKNQVKQLLQRPSMQRAAKQAEEWAAERGEAVTEAGSMRGMHDMKKAIDDEISVAVRAGKASQAKTLIETKDKLLGVMEKLSPAYKEAKATFAEMSKPVNQMEALQGLKVTNLEGKMTLGAVQRAIDGLEKAMAAPGARAAKSVTSEQLGTLHAIRDDLLRQGNLNAGKAAGSNTLQNIATDNAISTMLPGRIREIVGGKAGTFAGQLGQLMYSKPNEAIRNSLVDMMLDPTVAKRAMDAASRPILDGRRAAVLQDLANQAAPAVYRTAPVLSSDR
jgi:hypothetical protein